MMQSNRTELIVSTPYLIISCIGVLVVIGWLVLAVVVVATPGIWSGGLELASHLGIVLLLSGGCLLTGGLIGSVFAVPHTTAVLPPQELPPGEASSPLYRASTNLEQVSDWLTKVLIGAALVTVPGLLRGDTKLLQLNIISEAPSGWNATVTTAIVLYFGAAGLIGGYLLTRVVAAGEQLRINLRQGIEIAFNLPLSTGGLFADTISPADRQVLEPLLRLEPISLRNDEQRRAWARAQVASGNLDKADTVYQELTKRHEDDPELLLERSLLLVRLGKLDEANALRQRANPLLEVQGGAEARPEIILSTMFNDLYEAPPNGFEHVIAVGEASRSVCAPSHGFGPILPVPMVRSMRTACRKSRLALQAISERSETARFSAYVGRSSSIRIGVRSCACFGTRMLPKNRSKTISRLFTATRSFERLSTSTSSSIGRRDLLAGDISQTLLSFRTIPLIKYSGAVDVWVEDPKDGKKVSKLQSGMKYLLIVEFSSTLPQDPQGVSERIEVREGEVRNEVPFDLNPDATDIRFQPDKISVVVPHEGPPLRSRFEFTAPPRGASEIWLEIAQARRTIHMLQYPLAAS